MERSSSDAHPRPRLLLLHGAGLGRWIWDGVVPHVTAAVAEPLDLPGRSPGENPDEVTLQACVDFVRAQVGQSSAPVVLVGHSFSAEVALAVAAAVPALIQGLVLVGGVFPRQWEAVPVRVAIPAASHSAVLPSPRQERNQAPPKRREG